MPTELVTIEAVPILEVGTYELSTGERTFAEEDLIAAAAALNDPAVKVPRVKLGHIDPREGFDGPMLDGEPALGWVENLRVDASGQVLLGDYHVPDWLAETMEWAYPSRSIEGTPPGWISATGKQHELVITAVSLLGTYWPGVTTLDDLKDVLANGPAAEEPTQDTKATVMARIGPSRPVRAGLDFDLVNRRFYEWIEAGDAVLPDGTTPWDLWIRSMRFDDQGQAYLKVADDANGSLYRVDFNVSGNDVTFDGFQEVVEQDVPVAAGAARPSAPLASWESRADSRRVMATTEEHTMTDEQRRNLARSLGVAEDTSEDRLHQITAERAETPPAGDPPPAPDPDPTDPPADPPAEPPADPAPDPDARVEQPVAARLPDGVVAIDAEELKQLRHGAETATQLAARVANEDRDSVIQAAMSEGRFAPARREHFESLWARDPEGTRSLLTASESEGGLAPGLVPVAARGVAPQGESSQSEEADHDAFMARHFPQDRERLQAKRGGGEARIRQEV